MGFYKRWPRGKMSNINIYLACAKAMFHLAVQALNPSQQLNLDDHDTLVARQTTNRK